MVRFQIPTVFRSPLYSGPHGQSKICTVPLFQVIRESDPDPVFVNLVNDSFVLLVFWFAGTATRIDPDKDSIPPQQRGSVLREARNVEAEQA